MNEAGELQPMKDRIFGTPCLADGTGPVMARKLDECIGEWSIQPTSIIGMCWDTTAANTGAYRGSATLFEAELGHAILWLGCRHHVAELHIKHTDDKVRPMPSKGIFCLKNVQGIIRL